MHILQHDGVWDARIFPGHFRGQALGGVMSSPFGVGKYYIWYVKCFKWISTVGHFQGTPGTSG